MTASHTGDFSRCTHGTRSTYAYGCRCEACTEAHRIGCAADKARRPPLAPDDPRHGTTNAYINYSCRCLSCCQAYVLINASKARRKANA